VLTDRPRCVWGAQALYLGVLAAMVYGANAFAAIAYAPWYALAIHVVSWIMQFYGHGVYEKRKPALLDSLHQALTLAPLFVWLELLFSLGYNPAMAKKIDEDAKKAIAAWRKETTAGKSKAK
jgi:2-hydroxy fatty acid dioxygenase